MFKPGDKVKHVDGLRQGYVLEAFTCGTIDYVQVKWYQPTTLIPGQIVRSYMVVRNEIMIDAEKEACS